MASSAESLTSVAPSERKAAGRTLWLWVASGFLFLALLWAAMFVAARSVTIQSVPNAPGVHRKG